MSVYVILIKAGLCHNDNLKGLEHVYKLIRYSTHCQLIVDWNLEPQWTCTHCFRPDSYKNLTYRSITDIYTSSITHCEKNGGKDLTQDPDSRQSP